MRVLTIANQKGGVAKTTTSMSIADALISQGHRVLMVDLDPQGSLTSYLQLDPDQVDNTTYSLFDGQQTLVPRETGFEGLYIAPASIALAHLEKRAHSFKGKGLVIKDWLATQTTRFDFAVIDTPPALGMLMINALAACDQLVVPVQTDHLALKGLERMVKVLEMLKKSGQSIDYDLLPTMFDVRTNASRRALQVLKNRYPEHMSDHIIPIDTKLREASRLGVPPSFLFSESRGVRAYGQFTHQKLVEPFASI